MNDKKICVVTGASSGIGQAIARYLLADGYRVIVTARRRERLEELGASPDDILPGDLTKNSFLHALTTYTFETCGGCDYLFNCAGTIENGTVEEIDIERMALMIRLNIEATFKLTYAFLKQFRIRGRGHIINISSVLGTKVRPTAGAYAATKFAMEALSEALRMELAGSAVQISCIEPGLVMTELHNNWKVHPKESMGILEPLTVATIVDAVKYILTQPEHVRIPKLMILPRDHVI